jgi:hypothetical protein
MHGSDIAVLKRVAVPDKEALASMRTEVDTMVRHRPCLHKSRTVLIMVNV